CPFVRGIYSLTHLALPEDWNGERLKEAFRRSYKDCSFIRLLESPPELNAVRGSNYCDIHAAVEGRHAVILAALDNLVKGAAGQAVQNMNLMLGFDETEGLKAPGIYP
ncbi:MAG: N-acetyl-gamma-glutamyl-phosphate reductase, partial [Elusimicrobiota bacterium]